MPIKLQKREAKENKPALPGIFTNPIQWFITIPNRAFLLCIVAVMVLLGTLIILLTVLFADIKAKKT